jgi:[ribosomal protein S18]-alanine N-acetyltransferase
MSHYTLRPLNRMDARQMLTWRYDPPYHIYDVVPPALSAAELEHEIDFLVNPASCYFAVEEESGAGSGDLLAFCCFGLDAQVPGYDYTQQDALDIGLGMHPLKIGQGRGRLFLTAILEHARRLYHPRTYRATVATFNQRSQRMFLCAGFTPVTTFVSTTTDSRPFVVLSRSAEGGYVMRNP